MQFFKGMVEGGKNGGEVFGNGFAAAGEGNDDGASERPGDGAGNGGGGRLGEAGLHHRLFETRQAAFKDREQRLGCGVAWGEPCAAAGKDEIVSLTERQFHDKGAQRLRIVRDHKALFVAEREFGAGAGGHERPAFVYAQPGGSFVGKGNPRQGPVFAACGATYLHVFAEHYKKLDDPAKAEEVRQAVADWKREAAPHTWDK